MIRRNALIAAFIASSLNAAFGQESISASFQGRDLDQNTLITVPHPAAAKYANPGPSPAGGNPLWGIPISALSATRERPIFSASRRPSAPPAPPALVAEAPPPPPPEPERPLFTLVGTATGIPQNVALVVEQSTKHLIHLKVGEAASGWELRSVDSQTMTIEKNGRRCLRFAEMK
jgi:hypothetical protein